MKLESEQEYIAGRKTQLKYYRTIPLYCLSGNSSFVLYKPAGMILAEMRVATRRMPRQLYLRSSDKLAGIREIQHVFNKQLKHNIRINNPKKVKEIIVNILAETFSEPRSGSIEGLQVTIDTLVSDFANESDVIKNLLLISDKDCTTVLHSINVMALALCYASYRNYSMAQKRVLGLCALLHDVGKTKINTDLLTAPRKLTDEEFKEIQQHTVHGYQILAHCKFGNSEIKLTALQHHEKLDGTGYPQGRRHCSKFCQIIGLIDCYEALTNNDRPYRSAMEPFKALSLIKSDVEAGKFSPEIFKNFTSSLKSLNPNQPASVIRETPVTVPPPHLPEIDMHIGCRQLGEGLSPGKKIF
jgi:putative nucleotidyltransferase with HDIG domain